MRTLAAVVGVLLAAALLASPLAAESSATRVNLRLVEFKIQGGPLTAKRGAVTFAVKNNGTVAHELVVLKTTIAPSKLPVKRSKASEPGKVGRVGPIKRGKSAALNLTLSAGKYVLLCNLPAHYQAGQRVGFTAT
jgi:uncharacterized cupredoxin-like copper-binding protein